MVPLCISAFRSKVWTVCLNFDFGHVWQWKGQTNNRCSEDSLTLLPNVFFVWVSDRWQIAQSLSSVFWGQRWQVWKLQRFSWKVSCHKAGLSVRLLSCRTLVSSYWSYWGCGVDPRNAKNTHRQVNVVITNSSNHFLLSPNPFISDVTMKWYTIPGYNSLSPELVLSVFLNPISSVFQSSVTSVVRWRSGESQRAGRQRGKSLRWCLFYLRLRGFNKMLLRNLYTI